MAPGGEEEETCGKQNGIGSISFKNDVTNYYTSHNYHD